MSITRQLLIVHVSDIHFGEHHRFNPPATAKGDVPKDPDYPTLAGNLLQDLKGDDPGCPVILALSGDFAQVGSFDEFARSERLVKALAEKPLLGRERGLDSVFCVAGNHDVLFTSDDVGERWQQWTDFHNRLFGTTHRREDPWTAPQVHDRVETLGAVIVTLNSSALVQRGKPDEDRGHLLNRQLEGLEDELAAFDPQKLDSAIRVALVHHHPVLIPALVEGKRGNDSVHNAAMLLTILRRYGFHAVLHGHKHNPHVFTEDSRSAYVTAEPHPILVAAGGSAGSTELPTSPPCGNTYNQITITVAPGPRSHAYPRRYSGPPDAPERRGAPPPREVVMAHTQGRRSAVRGREPDAAVGRPKGPGLRRGRRRTGRTDARRGVQAPAWLVPVAEVLPSLQPKQHYEARLWLVRHKSRREQDDVRLVRVTWFAGPNFPVVTVNRDDDENLCGRLDYWGPMLVQARLEFADGYEAPTHLYARLPGQLGLVQGN